MIATGLAFGLAAAATLTSTAPAAQAEANGSATEFVLASYSAPLSVQAVGSPAAAGTDAAASEALNARATADAVITAAASVTNDVAVAGVEIAPADTTIDTAQLEAAVARLDVVEQLPAPLVPALTEDVQELAAEVDVRVNQVRGSLDGALAAKAAEEAAAQAAAEAAAAAEAEAKAAAESKQSTSSPAPRSSGPTTAPLGGGAVGGTSPADAQATARGMLASRGWGDDQFGCLVSLWQKESGWNYRASNPSSGAYGIPQALPGSKMSSAGADWQTNPATQIAWGLGYISSRYGDPCGAWAKSQASGWY